MAAIAPNAIEIRRVYTRQLGEEGPDQLLNAAVSNQLVVDWAAGSAANAALGTPGDVTVEVIMRTVTTNALVPALTNTPGAGTATDGENREGIYEWPMLLPPMNLVPVGTTFHAVVRIFAGPRISFGEWMFSS